MEISLLDKLKEQKLKNIKDRAAMAGTPIPDDIADAQADREARQAIASGEQPDVDKQPAPPTSDTLKDKMARQQQNLYGSPSDIKPDAPLQKPAAIQPVAEKPETEKVPPVAEASADALPEAPKAQTEPTAEQKDKPTPASGIHTIGLPSKEDFKTHVTDASERKDKLEAVAMKLPEEVRGEYTKKIDEYADRIKDAEYLYNQREERLNWGQTFELLGQALTQLAAGWYGMKTGYDLSGLKFNKVDWEKRLDRSFEKYDKDTNRFLKQQENTESSMERAENQATRTGEEEKKNLRNQYEKEDTLAVNQQGEYNKQNFETRKFNAAEQNKATLQSSKPANTSREDRRERDILGQKEKEVSKAEKLLTGDLPKLKHDSDKVKSLRSFLEARGIKGDELKKLESADDMIYTTDKERVDRLGSKASELLGKMKDDFGAAQKQYINRSPSTAPAEQPTKASGKVKVEDKDGNQFMLPEEQLDEALRSGYKQVD